MHLKILTALALTFDGATIASAQDTGMSFFVTSENPGQGANLGGFAGADAHCAALAEAAGSTGRSWAAYLSSSAEDARDRIGTGPWTNADGVVVADSMEQLHAGAPGLDKETALSETGAVINGRGDEPNRHDILTGSTAEGTMSPMGTCEDWTNGGDGATYVGHHDRMGGRANGESWNASHETLGCGLEALRETGGDGLLYCFATD